jgi:hypothetical protein
MQQIYEETLRRQLYLEGMSIIDVGQYCDLLVNSVLNYDEDCWEVEVITLRKQKVTIRGELVVRNIRRLSGHPVILVEELIC